MKIKDIAKHIGADSVKYLSYKGLIQGTGLSEDVFNTSCFTGEYPIDIGHHKKKIVAYT
jgi:amidophosphoribosyltransferase